MAQKGFDHYTWKARVQPALVVALPAAVAALAWSPKETLLVPAVSTLVVWAALGTLVSQIVRDIGARRQAVLFAIWGAAPTTRLLRHRGATDARLLELRHRKYRKLTGVNLPSATEETADPKRADALYETCVARLRELTRDHQLVFEENANYGFRRNLEALRPVALLVLVVSLALIGVLLWLMPEQIVGWLASGVHALFLLVWLFLVRPQWVRTAAERYARQLLAAADSLP